jgi:hypothetical protein
MRTLLSLVLLLSAVSCSTAPYGTVDCTSNAQCPADQQCINNWSRQADGGCPAEAPSKTCYQVCTTAADCKGFKKPICTSYVCNGAQKFCDEDPF